MHFACVCVSLCLAKGINRQRAKKERKGEENRKIKSDPFNAYTDACREAKDESIASIYEEKTDGY